MIYRKDLKQYRRASDTYYRVESYALYEFKYRQLQGERGREGAI